MFRILITLVIATSSLQLYSQADTIRLKQGSFEQRPVRGVEYGSSIKGWFDCGIINFPGNTPPDIHPVNFWGNTKQAYDGNTYLGMVVRDDDSYEAVSQKLSSPLKAGECYSFSVYLSQSAKYISGSKQLKIADPIFNYDTPSVLRIWGGSGYCGEKQLLGETVPISHTEWKPYEFKFTPQFNHRYITIEAFYKTPMLITYNGHVLVDAMSHIVRIDCEEKEVIAEVEIDKKPKLPPHKRRKKKPVQKPTPKEDNTQVMAKAEVPKLLKALDRKKIREGQTIEIENLYFTADSTDIKEASFEVLGEVYGFLAANSDVVVEIGGHTNGTPKHAFCDRLSKKRAKSVAQYLVQKGISPSKIKFRGYGKRKPIANNLTPEGRRKNQRVEIKILSIG